MLYAAASPPPRWPPSRQHQPFVAPADVRLRAPPPATLTRAEWASSPAWVRDRLPAPPLTATTTTIDPAGETRIVEYQAAAATALPPQVMPASPSSAPPQAAPAVYASSSPFSSRLLGYLNQPLSELQSPPAATGLRQPPRVSSSATSPSTSVPPVNLGSSTPARSPAPRLTRPRLVAPTSDQKLDVALHRLYMAPDPVPHRPATDIVPIPSRSHDLNLEIIPSPKPVRRPPKKLRPPPKPRWQNPTGCRSVRRGLDDIPVGGTSPSKVVSKRQTHKTTVDPKMYVPVQQRPIYDSQLYLQYPIITTSVRRIEL